MISVLFLIPTLDRGGAENVLVDLVNHMDQSKFQITVQTLFDQNSQKSRLKKGIEYRTFLKHQFRGNSRLFARIPAGLLYRVIVRKRYDIVVSYLEGPTTHIVSGCPYSNSKKVAWIHSSLDTERALAAGFISKKDAVKAYQALDRVVFVAVSAREKVENIAGKPFSNALVLYNSIDTGYVKSCAKEPITDGLFSDDEFCIVSTGKITSVKGYDRLAHVQKRLVESGYKTHIYIIGEGKDRQELEKYAAENSLSDSFTFLGFQNNPYKYVSKSDLFVCSSRREGFSTSISEALILGIPVVSTSCSGAHELLGDDSEYGIVTDNSEEGLYQGLTQIIEDNDLLSHYRKRAVERGKMFDIEKSVKSVESMFDTIIGDHMSIRIRINK